MLIVDTSFVTTVQADDQELCLLRSYENQYQPPSNLDEWELWEALRATSAANTYFKEHSRGNVRYLDGALKANNPVFQVLAEARELWDDPEVLMVSIGTGEKAPAPIQGNIIALAKTLTKTLLNTGDTEKRFRREHKSMVDDGLIYRFSVPSLGRVKMENYRAIPAVIQETGRFMGELSELTQLMACSNKIQYMLSIDYKEGETEPVRLVDLSKEEKCKTIFTLTPTVADYVQPA